VSERVTRQAGPTVGLPAQGAVNGLGVARALSSISTTHSIDLSRDLSRRLLPVQSVKGHDGADGKRRREPRIGAAEYLGVSVRSLWRLVDNGHLHPVRLPGVSRVLFDVHELDALIEKSRD